MPQLDDTKHRLELLKIARELLNEEYINRRAQDHNKWLAESDVVWKTTRTKLPYPPFAAYPTDEEIVSKATRLYSFVNSGASATNPAETHTVEPPPVAELTHVEQTAITKISKSPEVTVPASTPTPWETYLGTSAEDSTCEVAEVAAKQESSSVITDMLPGWIRRPKSA